MEILIPVSRITGKRMKINLLVKPLSAKWVAKKSNSGFTLLELLILMVIVSILLAVALPTFETTIARMNVNSATKRLGTFLSDARSEAVTRIMPVSVCSSTNGTACQAGNWNNGWIIFSDMDQDGVIDSADGDEVIRVEYPSSNAVYTSQDSGGAAINYISYNTRGASPGLERSFKICPANDDSTLARQWFIGITGRQRLETSGVACP